MSTPETKPPRAARYDAFSWVTGILSLVAVLLGVDLHDPGQRIVLIVCGAIMATLIAVGAYGCVFVLPRLSERMLLPRPSFTPIARGPFRGWNPRVVRRSFVALLVLITAGSGAGYLIENGQAIAGGVLAASALVASPDVLGTLLALSIRPPRADES